jgi:hypothetical protein
MVNEKSIFDTLNEFSFPRLSGTKSEKEAFNIILKKINSLGIDPTTQEFQFSTFFSRVYPKIVFFLGFLTVSLLFFFLDVPVIIVFSLINGSIILLLVLLMRKPAKVRFYKYLESANIYVKLPPKSHQNQNLNKKMDLFFICHLDSKAQRFIILKRVRAIRRWVFSLLIITGLIIIRIFISGFFLIVILIIGIIPMVFNAISTIIILLNTTSNTSPGVIDNASGIACVFELLNHYVGKNNRLKNLFTWFVFTGAEETGTMGIRNFYQRMKHLDKNSVMVINFDAIGRAITLFDSWFKPDWYLNFYDNFVNQQQIYEDPNRVTFGSHSDGYFFKKKLYPGVEFGDLSSYKYMHSKDDTIDKVDPKLLKHLCEVIIDNVREFDELNAK